MLFCGFNKTTLLDYPEHVAATVFLGGCNFRCPFCQNKDLLLQPAEYATFTEEEILDYLQKRSRILSGVCVSGGEPTLYKDLPDFIAKIKAMGYLVKLDTNGSNPSMIKLLYEQRLIDYVAMDIKTGPSDYLKVAGVNHLTASESEVSCNSQMQTTNIFYASATSLMDSIKESIQFLMHEADPDRLDYEFRTTVVRELHNEASFTEIGSWIAGAKHYFLQSYKESENVLCPGFHAYSKEELDAFADQLHAQIPSVMLRGVE